jgi:hypothetical protein
MKNQLHSALGFNNGLEVRVLPTRLFQFFSPLEGDYPLQLFAADVDGG